MPGAVSGTLQKRVLCRGGQRSLRDGAHSLHNEGRPLHNEERSVHTEERWVYTEEGWVHTEERGNVPKTVGRLWNVRYASSAVEEFRFDRFAISTYYLKDASGEH